MLCIIFENQSSVLGNRTPDNETDIVWYVGEHLPEFDVHKVCEIQVDGHELEVIENTFPNFPIPRDRRTVRFFGDFARMVVGNLSKEG